MKNPLIIVSLLAILACSCGQTTKQKYDYPLNTIEAIKYYEPADKGYAYRSVTLTPTEYQRTSSLNTLIAKAIYKGEVIGIKIIENRRKDGEIIFKSIGKESDNFVKAIAELYEENATENITMRSQIKCDALETDFVNWNLSDHFFKVSATALNGKSAGMYLCITIPTDHTITIGDKEKGLSKKRFVDVFRENVK